jgi:predicted enzyme related to lactoylglutathione lyase
LRETNPIKPVFMVNSISHTRELIEQTGGKIFGANKEFIHGDLTYCDGFDPDGNVIQACEQTNHE